MASISLRWYNRWVKKNKPTAEKTIMFLVDQPYLSEFFKQTVRDHHIPLVDTPAARGLGLLPGTNLISESQAVEMMQANPALPLYTTSENAIGWIARQLAFSDLPNKIELFKNKVKFREMIRSLSPDFFFQEIPVEQIGNLAIEELPLPFVIKPTAGFFSMGVYKVSRREEWASTVDSILAEMGRLKGSYPEEVLNLASFIIEECIEGEEFALDAYFNADGEAVILSILQHSFSSDADVGDRIYTTSKEIIENNRAEFTAFAGKIGTLAGVSNFPVHIELRRRVDGVLLPIEVNPMRFGGWCTTADLSYLAFGFNPYLYYAHQQQPDWQTLLDEKDGKRYSLIILDNATGVPAEKITAFDYDKLLAGFENPLELRKMDYRRYPVFGFLFTETSPENSRELTAILASDLREFITIG